MIRWGILGTGWVARDFVKAMLRVPDSEVIAIGSRTQANANLFGHALDIPRCYGSYEMLVVDPDVDIVYVATPHSEHAANSILAMEAGKAVLCEKPFTVNANEAYKVVNTAANMDVFCMEAMWTRFFPAMREVHRLIIDGAIGEPKMVLSNFGFYCNEPDSRFFNPNLAGGALLDNGIYCVSLDSMVIGQPEEVVALGHLGRSGVDEQVGVVLKHAEGQLSIFSSSIQAQPLREAQIVGTEGRIHIYYPWWKPSEIAVHGEGNLPKIMRFDDLGNDGLSYEIEAVQDLLLEGKTQSTIMPLWETIQQMETLDEIRKQIGLRFLFE